MKLQDYLNEIGARSGDERMFILQEGQNMSIMEVSRRYLESESWKHLLQREVQAIETSYNQWKECYEMKIIIEENESLT